MKASQAFSLAVKIWLVLIYIAVHVTAVIKLQGEEPGNIISAIFLLFSTIIHLAYFTQMYIESDEYNGDWQKLLRWIDKIAGDK